jgi:hypothetical protein
MIRKKITKNVGRHKEKVIVGSPVQQKSQQRGGDSGQLSTET